MLTPHWRRRGFFRLGEYVAGHPGSIPGKHDYAFVHMTLKIGSGRSLESRQEVGEMLFDLIKTHFASLMESRYLALSFEIAELHPTLNFKQNNVHALFK